MIRLLSALLLLPGVACTSPQPPPRPDLLLITFDTTRADALGCYGARPSPSPVLDALAARGLRVDEAMSVAPLTLPAHTSMLSGLYPDRHGIRDNGRSLPPELLSVAVPLQQAGWHTGAVVGAVVLDGSLGLDRGFDDYHDGFDISRVEGVHDEGATRPAEQVADAALDWLDAAPDQGPVFLWVHLYDPHLPLVAPASFQASYADPYAAEIAYADHHAGRLLQAFTDRDRPHLIVVAGDHGEGRGDHGELTHGQLVYRSTMRVPLLVAGTSVDPQVRAGPVSIADVAPTLAQAAGVSLPQVDGRSLLDPPAAQRVVYGESYHQRYALGLSELHVWQDAEHRYIDAPRPELYAWSTDPDEALSLAPTRPQAVQSWQARVQDWRAARPEPLERSSSAVDPATAQALAALGYLPSAQPEPHAQLPDPKDHPGLQSRVDALMILARTRPPAQAVPLLRAFLDEHPRVHAIRVLLIRALHLSGDVDGALHELSGLLARAPDDVGLHAQAAELHLAAGRLQEARTHLDQASTIAPTQPSVAALRGELARRTGTCAQVLPVLDASVEQHPEASRTRVVRGACRRAQGDLDGAISDLAHVREQDPDNPDVHYLLGLTHLARGEAEAAVPLLREQLRLTPDAPLAHGALGLALLQLGRPDQALESLTTASADPVSGVEAPLALAEALLAVQADDAEITRALDLADTRSPDDPRVLRVRAAHLVRQGRASEALEVMLRARGLQERALRGDGAVKDAIPRDTHPPATGGTVRP